MKETRPDRNDFIQVASSSDMTGSIPTPPLTDDEADAYAELGGVPAGIPAPIGAKRRAIPTDPCIGERR